MNIASARFNAPSPLVSLLLGFVVGALFLLALYLGILTVANSWQHAVELLSQDLLWVTLVSIGFGAQVGLYLYLRALTFAVHLRGAALTTGAGAGTSSLGMIACCLHHVTDVAPLIGLAGFGSVASFLTEWKIPFIVFGLIINAMSIAITFRTIRKVSV